MALTEEKSGFLSGGAIGAQFGGPLGFVVGAAVGGFFGSKSKKKRKRQEEKLLTANTKQAFSIGGQTLTALRQGRENAAEQYTRNLASSRAKFAASGGRLEGQSFESVLGKSAKERDETIAAIDTEQEIFKKSEAYKFMKQDFDYMRTSDNTLDKLEVRTEGRGGTSYYTDAQKKLLRTSDRGSKSEQSGYRRIFNEYQQSVTPSLDQYESFLFGNDQDKAQYESDLTQQINNANSIFDEKYLVQKLDNIPRGGAGNIGERKRLQTELAQVRAN